MNKLNYKQKEEVMKRSVSTDISIIYQVCECLEIATNRGAYKETELTYVGSLYDGLNRVLNVAVNQKLKEKPQELIN